MIGNWQIAHLPLPKRFFEYAGAYLQASISVCLAMQSHESQRTWPNACVALMLAAHAVELFLKGAILLRDPKRDVGTHKLDELKEAYDNLFPQPEFNWDLPFKCHYIGFSAEEAAALAKDQPVPSIMYRYPADRDRVSWEGAHAFKPDEFLGTLGELYESFHRLRARIDGVQEGGGNGR